ncbi:MFS transporter [Bauldia sp.]|uniref:MFS transporter n=1 Tax=Bauldia sp. TaxID=2575872 RepID=UPI003BAA7121
MDQSAGGRSRWLIVMLPFGLGYAVAMGTRSINAILAHPLETELGLTSAELGVITATFLITFALAQLPLGLLLDRWGARVTHALFFVIGGIGMILFGLASDPVVLALARGLLGIGMATGLMGAFKGITEWFPRDRIAYYNGLILAAGGLGAVLATSPAKFLEGEFGWRVVCFVFGVAAFAVAAIVLLLYRDRNVATPTSFRDEVSGLIAIYRDRFFWAIAPLFAINAGVFIAMQGLWFGPWFQKVVGLTPQVSAHYLLAVTLSMTVGYLCGGWFASLGKRIGRPATFVIGVAAALGIAFQVALIVGIAERSLLLWFVYIFVVQVVMVNYALLAEHFGQERAGRAVTAGNILVFLAAAIAQFGFGIIASLWPSTDAATGFRVAFAVLVALQAVALVWFVVRLTGAKAAAASQDAKA